MPRFGKKIRTFFYKICLIDYTFAENSNRDSLRSSRLKEREKCKTIIIETKHLNKRGKYNEKVNHSRNSRGCSYCRRV